MGLENRYCLVQACAGLAPFSPEMLQAGAVKGPAQTVPKKKKGKKKRSDFCVLAVSSVSK